MSRGKWSCPEYPFCEHCHELEPYSLEYGDGNVSWCEACGRDIGSDPSPQMKQEERDKKVAYFKRRIKEIESDV